MAGMKKRREYGYWRMEFKMSILDDIDSIAIEIGLTGNLAPQRHY